MTFTKKSLVAVLVTLSVVVFYVTYTGFNRGGERAAQALPRLQQVWPNFQDMPDADRTLVAILAMTCRLEERPVSAGSTIDCLYEALLNQNPPLPNGMDRNAATQRLKQLLADRP